MPRKSTRNAQGGGTIRKRSDGRWEARFTLGRDPGSGRQIQRSVYGTTQTEVRKKLQQATTAIDEGIYTEPSKLTVAAWLDIWLAEYLLGVKPRTLDSYKTTCNHHIRPAIGAVKLNALNTPTIQAFYNKLQKAGLSPKTIKNLHGVLHKALAQAVEIGYLKYNVSGACKLPRIEKAEIKPLDNDSIGKFLAAIKGHDFETVFTVTLFTGMRQGEVLGLTWDCVNFEKGTINVNKQLQKERGGGGKYMLVSPKNSKGRQITPASAVMNILKAHKVKQIEWQLRAGPAWENDMNLVFTNQLGHNLSAQTVYLHFKKVAKDLGLPEARFHDLRHSYAVAALQSGDSVKTVQETLGHHTAAFTLDIYGHVTEEMKKESSERMDRFIKGISNL